MLNLLMLSTVICGVSIQSIMQKSFNARTPQGGFVFSAVSSLFAGIFFIIISGGRLSFQPEVALYSLLFALVYAISIIGSFLAVGSGPLSLTSLLTSYSLIIPAVYGMIFLKESADTALIIGIALLLVSLALINCEKKGQEKKISARWFVFVLLAFLGNGMCTVVQKIQQQTFSGAYKSEFMIGALFLVFTVFSVLARLFEPRSVKPALSGIHLCGICGIANGAVNFLVMVLTNRMEISVMFPLISAGGIILTYFLSRIMYKEKFSAAQNIGVILGIGAVIFLNL